MIFEGASLTVTLRESQLADVVFDAQGSVNKFDQSTLKELASALDAMRNHADIKGAMFRSNKPTFIVGADITEFNQLFKLPKAEMLHWLSSTSDLFTQIEDLPFPTISVLNGFALGGGFELALSTDFRIADSTAKVGLPEVKLGLMPGFGGSVRLPRVIGADNSVEWMTTGKEYRSDAAFSVGAVDAVTQPESLVDAATDMLNSAISGDLDWQSRRAQKLNPLPLSQNEAMMSAVTTKGMVFAQAGKHYPAPMVIVESVAKAAGVGRADALVIEQEGFWQLSTTSESAAQIGIFLADQRVKATAKGYAKGSSSPIKSAAVLGAGIMGGGIAYQSAVKGVPAVMKDIRQEALDLGMKEASSILLKGMKRGKVKPEKMAATLASITPTLQLDAVSDAEVVVEAVVENPAVKSAVLAETEAAISDNAILCSNTSTISIDHLAKAVKRPENFCGMHFFNPVHRMPLVEIIRGEKTSDETIAKVVAYSLQMGKTPIVVNDCPGFFVNRVLFPYFAGFSQLILDGADFVAVDKVMEKIFGWPMGPAFLLDVVGIDTADHAAHVMADGIPERLSLIENDPTQLLFKAQRLGQKNGKGFYNHGLDKRGKPMKTPAEEAYELIKPHCKPQQSFETDDIIARLMIPMINESVRCLEEGIVASPEEADMALLYGLGFPPFRGGVFRYIETLGIANFVELAAQYEHLGPMYVLTDTLKSMATNGQHYFNQ